MFYQLNFFLLFFLVGLGTLRAGKIQENLIFLEVITIFIMGICLVVITIGLVILFIYLLSIYK